MREAATAARQAYDDYEDSKKAGEPAAHQFALLMEARRGRQRILDTMTMMLTLSGLTDDVMKEDVESRSGSSEPGQDEWDDTLEAAATIVSQAPALERKIRKYHKLAKKAIMWTMYRPE